MRNEPPKNNRLKTSYVLIYITSLPFRVREAHHLITRLLIRKIIAHIRLSGNLFFQPSWTQKGQRACGLLTYRMALAKQVRVQGRFLATEP